jgi:hypothetical protein
LMMLDATKSAQQRYWAFIDKKIKLTS